MSTPAHMYDAGIISNFNVEFQAKSKCCNISEKGSTNNCTHEGASVKSQPPLIAKWRNGVKLQLPGRFDGDGKIYNATNYTN